MQMQSGGLRRSKAFATEAGVSVRTLHLYDRLGLLRPAAVSPSGYRLYGEAELERLEHILALRFVGLRLNQIKELLGGPDQPLVAALRMQREVIAHQKQGLESALTLIEEAERALIAGASADRWKILRPSWRDSKCRTTGSGRKSTTRKRAVKESTNAGEA